MVFHESKHDHFSAGADLFNLRQRGDAIHDGHLNVQQDHIHGYVLNKVEQVHAVVGLCNDLDIFLGT